MNTTSADANGPTHSRAPGPAMIRPRLLVLGGTGFIGRHVVQSALRSGHPVVIGSRFPERVLRKLPDLAGCCELRRVRMEQLQQPADWQGLLAEVDAVVNTVGILRERWGETYERVHHHAPAALATACAAHGLRLVHVSALGLHPQAASGFLRSKWHGEQALQRSGADYSLVRPSLLDGEGGYGALWLRRVAGWPLHAIPVSARGRIAVLRVSDLGDAIVALCAQGGEEWREVEVGGERGLNMREHLAALREQRGLRPAWYLPLPHWLARLASHVCDLLHLTPYSFGHLELMSRDNLPLRGNRLPELLVLARRRGSLAENTAAPR